MEMKRCTFVSMMMFAAAAIFAQSDLQVLAVVKLNKSESITVRQLKTRVGVYEKQAGKVLSIDERKQTLDALIYEKLVNQAAQKSGIVIPDSDINQYFLQSMSQMVGKQVTEQELNTIVRQQTKMSLDEFMKQQAGMSVAEYKDYLKSQLTAQQYIVSQRQSELQSIAPTDSEIRSFYEMHKANFVWSDMLLLFLVYVPKDSNAAAAKTKAADLLAAYKNKKSTREQLIVQSRADNSNFRAGELLVNKTESGAIELGVPFSILIDLFKREKGFISEVQDNETNCQFYSIIEKYDAKMLAISDVVQPGTTVTVYDYIRQNLGQQKQMEYLQKAADEISKSLDTNGNVERKKTGTDLDKFLSW
ncbi:MAG: peptidyl-prolyl cis-trans isomerase [Treponema sp.]|nr:peptidyl-prolyl cis-trans isomerase [Treponema sp.]